MERFGVIWESKLEPKLVENHEKSVQEKNVRTWFLRVAFSGVLLPNVLNRISGGRRERERQRDRQRDRERGRGRRREIDRRPKTET